MKDVGIYEICILNRYASSRKAVYLGLYSEEPDKTWPFTQLNYMENTKNEEAEMIMDMAASEISVSFSFLYSLYLSDVGSRNKTLASCGLV